MPFIHKMELTTVEKWQHTPDVEVFLDPSDRKLIFKKCSFIYTLGLDDRVSNKYQDLGEYSEKCLALAFAPGERLLLFARNDREVVGCM